MAEAGFIASILALSYYWLLPMAVITVILFWGAINENGVAVSIMSIILTITIFTGVDGLFAEVVSHPMAIITYLIGYTCIGVTWMVFRWYKFVLRAKDNGAKEAPRADDNKDWLFFWATTWPLDIVLYMLRDLIIDLAKAIYKRIGGSLQRISDKVFED